MTEKENSTMRSRSFRLDRRLDRRPDRHAAPETPQNRLSSQRVTRQSFQKYDKRRRKRGSSFAQGIGLAAMLLLLGDVLVVGESTEEERESPFSEKLLSSSKNNLISPSNNSRPEVDRVFAVLHSEENDRNGSTTRINSVVELNETSSSTPLIVTTMINASENSVFDGKLFATESPEILENSIQQSKPSRRILTSDAVRTSTVTTTSERNMKSVKSESVESSEGKMIEVTAKIDANTEESGESTMPTSGTTALEYEFVGLTDLPTTTLVVSITVSSDTVSASVEKSTTDMTTTTVSTTTSQESTDSFSTISETTIATTQETGNLNFSVTDAPSGFTEAIQTTSESSDSTTTDLAENITESITEISMESGRSITGNIVRSVENNENTESITESTTESSTESAESTEIIIENVTVVGNGENVTEKTTQSTETTEDIEKTTISIDNNVDSSTESKNIVNNTEKTTQSTEATESIINTTISTNNTIDSSTERKSNINNSVIETTVDSMTNEVTDEIIHKIVENTTDEITTINMIDATTVVIVDNHSTTRPPGRKSYDAGDVTSLVKIELEGTWKEVCPCMKKMKNVLAEILSKGTDKEMSSTQIKIHGNFCSEDGTVSSAAASIDGSPTSLLIYIVDENGKFDNDMTRILPTLLKEPSVSGKFPLTIHGIFLVPSFLQDNSGNAIAVVIVSSVAFICLLLLAALLFIMRKRQARFNYGERCRPVSLDAYSLDSVSAYNSVRRKGATRSSKRSYGNPTFEDSSAVPSHPLNFAGLSSFCNDLNAINEEFLNIPQVTAKIDELPPGAEVKNRYANVIPLPESRVTLQRVGNDPLSEYINANYVRGPKNVSKYYIACQAPMESTVTDFWRMIWEQRCKIIIMLTDLVENGVEKCTEYVPPSEVTDCHRLYGDFQVTLKKRETKEKYAISTLHLKNLENNTFREVFHIWYLWPENSVQTDGAGLIAVLLEARALQRGGPGPVVVHCSPGTGRTGTLIALDLAIRQYEVTRTVDVPRVVYTIRRDRAGAVQTKEQYAFIYKVLNLYATKLAGGLFEST